MSVPASAPLPSFADVEAAALRIQGGCLVTPLLESPVLNKALGGRLLVKAENLQTTGSFKLRGALNRLSVMTADERRRGVIARSSGNHGLAVAYCAGERGVNAVVVAPASAPKVKIDQIRAFGATVTLVEDIRDLAAVAAKIAADDDRLFIPPADDPWVVAGAGVVGMEIVQQARAIGLELDCLLTCCSGGGLTAGCLLAIDALSPGAVVIGVEPAGFDKMAQSLRAGRPVMSERVGSTICDALSGPYMAPIAFEIVKNRLGPGVAVSDEEAKAAMRVAFSEFGLAVEPGGAVALAAVLTGKVSIAGRVVAVTLSGRNVDLDLAGDALAGR